MVLVPIESSELVPPVLRDGSDVDADIVFIGYV